MNDKQHFTTGDPHLQGSPQARDLQLQLVTVLLQASDMLAQSLVFKHDLLVHLCTHHMHNNQKSRYPQPTHLACTLQHLLERCLSAVGLGTLLGKLHDELVDDLLRHAGQCNTVGDTLDAFGGLGN